MSRNKDRGTWAETAVVECAHYSGFPFADRLTLKGGKDRGDVGLCPGVVCEVKNSRAFDYPGWLAETAVEKVNAKAAVAFLVVKPEGVGRIRTRDWLSVMYLGEWGELHHAAGMPAGYEVTEVLPGSRYKSQVAQLARSRTWDGRLVVKATGVDDEPFWYTMSRLHRQFSLLRHAGYGQEVVRDG